MPERFMLPANQTPADPDRTLALIAPGPLALLARAALHFERKSLKMPSSFNGAVVPAIGNSFVWHTLDRIHPHPETTLQTAAHPSGTAGALIHV